MRGTPLISTLFALLVAGCGNDTVKQVPPKPGATLQADSARITYRQEFKLYNDSLDNMISMVNLKVVSVTPRADAFGDTTINFNYTVISGSAAQIIGFEGYIIVIDIFGHKIEKVYFEQQKSLNRKSVITGNVSDGAEGNSITRQKIENTAFGRLKFKWLPIQIVFADGKTIEEPLEPETPDAPDESDEPE